MMFVLVFWVSRDVSLARLISRVRLFFDCLVCLSLLPRDLFLVLLFSRLGFSGVIRCLLVITLFS